MRNIGLYNGWSYSRRHRERVEDHGPSVVGARRNSNATASAARRIESKSKDMGAGMEEAGRAERVDIGEEKRYAGWERQLSLRNSFRGQEHGTLAAIALVTS